jgi:GntR family transcriptional regulator of arabinose operon
VSSSLKLTARKRLVSILSEEILSRSESDAFLIPSEHTLCRRFNISRVTVRLALSDLETKGLIYRKHGKGTFAHRRSARVQKGVAVLLKSSDAMERWPISEIVRGMQSYLKLQHSPVTLLTLSPKEWTSELTNSLAGVVIFPEDVFGDELEVLKNWKLPFLFASKTSLPGPRIILGQSEAARIMTEKLLLLGHQRLALITGYHPSLDAPKREGVCQALRSVGLDLMQMTEIAVSSSDEASLEAIGAVLKQRERPTGWIAFDDSFAAMLNFCARRQGLSVPKDISIVSFHDFSYFRYLEPSLTTVRFEFFAAGQRAAESLYRAFLTGEEIQDIRFEPGYRPGQSVARSRGTP